ncbi:hypothetical protein [Kitasatospora nipponensis]|uniref:hypothetical protein n=1 Tax=Kitasatospora nipponensis TaxID=258049 RepID=UPI0031D4BF55
MGTAVATVTVTGSVAVTGEPSAVASPADDPAAVVSAYYAAINAHDYAKAWALGGRNLGGGYAAFAAGFAGTVHDDLQIVSSAGGTVSVRIVSTLGSGANQVFAGTYTVAAGAITGADVAVAGASAASVAPGATGLPVPGEFCTPDGAVGVTKEGKVVHCTTTATDSRDRWRHV